MAKAKKVVAPTISPIKAKFFAATTEAVQTEGKAQYQWKDIVAPMAIEVYGTFATFCESQAEVENLAIVPGLDEAQRAAFTTKLPNAKTKEGKAEGQKEKRELRKKAQDKVSKYFARLCEYAFPEEYEAAQKAKRGAKGGAGEGDGDGEGEGEGDTGAVDAKTLANKTLPALRKKVGEDEEPTYDPVRAAKLIDELMAVFNTMSAE